MSRFNGSAANIEDNRNKVTSITEKSTDTQYPSAKATFELFDGMKMPDLTGCIRMWKPKTEYKVGDVVIANLQEVLVFEDNLYLPEPSRTIIAKCIESHTSTTPFSLYNNNLSGNVWEILQETKAYYDALGRGIHNTYATKEELAEAIGQALEGDY